MTERLNSLKRVTVGLLSAAYIALDLLPTLAYFAWDYSDGIGRLRSDATYFHGVISAVSEEALFRAFSLRSSHCSPCGAFLLRGITH